MAEESKDLVPAAAPQRPDRWEIMRDVLVFQAKLVVDGARDVLMSPVSLAAALVGLVVGRDRPGQYFYEVVRFGRRTERWINLFGMADHLGPAAKPARTGDDAGIDGYVQRVEEMIVDQYQKGGMTASAKATIDRVLDSIQEKTRRAPK